MKKAKEKKSSGWLHLDPRSKLLILVLFSVVVMIDGRCGWPGIYRPGHHDVYTCCSCVSGGENANRCAVYGFIHSRNLASDLRTAASRRRCGDAYPFSLLYGDTIRPYDDYGMVLHINYKDQ